MDISKFVSNRSKSVTFPGIRKMLQMAEGLEGIVSFALGEPDFDTPQHIKEVAFNALREGFTKYTSNYGIPELRNAIAAKLKRENSVLVDPKTEVLVTAGAQEALYLVFQAFINPGDEVIVTDPCYHSYPRMIMLAGGKPVPVPLNQKEDFRLHVDDLERRMNPKTKMILLNSPQNPAGSVLDSSDLKKIASIAESHDLLVATDEIYEKLIYDATHVSIASLPGMAERTITINGFSKTYAMTGWRIGYCVAKKNLLDEMVKTHSYSATCANSIAQKAATAALNGPQDCVTDMVREFTRRRDYVVKRLSEMKGVDCPKPRGAFYVFPNFLSFSKTSFALAEHLLTKAKIITVPGLEYGPSNNYHLRLSFATSMENLEIGLDRLDAGLRGLRR